MATDMAIKPYWQNYINGRFVDGGSGRLTVTNPSDNSPVAEIALASAADVDAAVAAARARYNSRVLPSMRPVELGRMVRAIGDHLLPAKMKLPPYFASKQASLIGKRYRGRGAARYFEYYGNQAETMEGRSIPLGADYLDFTIYEPVGVSAQIIPWNFPLEMEARGLRCAGDGQYLRDENTRT